MKICAWLCIASLGWTVTSCQSSEDIGESGGNAGAMGGGSMPESAIDGAPAAESGGGGASASGGRDDEGGTPHDGAGGASTRTASIAAGAGGQDDDGSQGGSAGGTYLVDSGTGGTQPTDAGVAMDASNSYCPFGNAEVFLWPGTAPGSESVSLTEKVEELSNNPAIHDRHISDVSKPSITPFLAEHPNGAAALIMPGGAYSLLAFDLEGVDIAKWLNSIGVSAFVVKYRLPADFSQTWIALADAQRAMRLVRNGAPACGIDPKRIGVVGFSAGGSNASQLETRPSATTTPNVDNIDKLDARPNFGLLLYPVISMDPSITHTGSRNNLIGSNPSAADVTLYSSEKQVTESTPPTFIGVSKKDTGVNPQNSVVFDNALKAAQVPEELHMYNDGAHGTGIRLATGDMAQWPADGASWLAKMKFTIALP